MGFLAHRLAITHCTDYCALLDLQQICAKISPLGCSRSPGVRRPSDNSPHPSRSLHLELIIGRKMPYEYGKLWSRTSQQSRLSLRGRARRQRSSGRSRQTSKGLLLDAPSVPLAAASSTITALSTAVRVRWSAVSNRPRCRARSQLPSNPSAPAVARPAP